MKRQLAKCTGVNFKELPIFANCTANMLLKINRLKCLIVWRLSFLLLLIFNIIIKPQTPAHTHFIHHKIWFWPFLVSPLLYSHCRHSPSAWNFMRSNKVKMCVQVCDWKPSKIPIYPSAMRTCAHLIGAIRPLMNTLNRNK